MLYHIAEIFSSIQGEGAHAGTAMSFIRLAGCNVGRPPSVEQTVEQPQSFTNAGYIYRDQCTGWDGRHFLCDTDYRVKEHLSVEDILTRLRGGRPHIETSGMLPIPRPGGGPRAVCITGGEPFAQNIEPLVAQLLLHSYTPHIETSGTLPIPRLTSAVWVTCSPKVGYLESVLERANEIKILVDPLGFDEEKFLAAFAKYGTRVWIQPVNNVFSVDDKALVRCIQLVEKYPWLKLSTQMQKVWRIR